MTATTDVRFGSGSHSPGPDPNRSDGVAPDAKSVLADMARLLDKYLLTAADEDQRAQIVNMAGLWRYLSAYTHALTNELAHYAAEAADARDECARLRAELADAQVERQERDAEIAWAADDAERLDLGRDEWWLR